MHKSVLIKETLDYLNCDDKHIIVDCTVGPGGHAKEILKRLPSGGRLIGIDTDIETLKVAEENLTQFKGRYILAHENFRNFDKILHQHKIDGVDGMLFDLGVSSLQLDDYERGFSFFKNAPLDMRMDNTSGKPLWEILNGLSEDELGRIIRDFGEERFWRRIAKAIVAERKESPIKDTLVLANLIRRFWRYRAGSRIDPATRTFQAFRIFINDELGALSESLGKASSFLNNGGRIVVISFHSLEDRIVKNKFKEAVAKGILTNLTKKPIRPTEEEIRGNPRSRSARLRAAQRL